MIGDRYFSTLSSACAVGTALPPRGEKEQERKSDTTVLAREVMGGEGCCGCSEGRKKAPSLR